MEDESKIGRWSWGYELVRIIAKAAFKVFYRKIHVTGKENIPREGGIIFAANHQNALMDALAIIMNVKYQPVFLARADIFRTPLVARVLRFLKIMPVYRIRDGVDSMGQNEDTFMKTSNILASGGCIGIMPEGNHGPMKRLRILKKGIFRIAFRAGEDFPESPPVKIVPVGLDYSNTHRIFQELTVNFGRPLKVSDYHHIYSEHPQKGINAMKNDLAARLKSLIIDINDEENYNRDKLLTDIGSRMLLNRRSLPGKGCHNKFKLSSVFSRALYEYFEQKPDKAGELRRKSGRLLELSANYNVSTDVLDAAGQNSTFHIMVRSLFCFPFYIAGMLMNLLPLAVIHLILKNLKDEQFISSFKFVLGLLLFPLYYFLLALLAFSLLTPAMAITLILAAPLAGVLAFNCKRQSERLKERLQLKRISAGNISGASLISGLYSEIESGLGPVSESVRLKLKY